MWIATLGGLNRYNGYEFMQYVHDAADSTSLNDDFVFSLFFDSSHRLWVGTTVGVNRYDFATNRFIRYSGESEPVYSFYEDHNRRIWVASPAGTGWIDTLQRNVILSRHERNVNLYWEDSSLRLWMGASDDRGLAVRKDDSSWEFYSLPGSRWVTGMYSDPQGVWWLGTNAGLVLFDPVSRTFKDPPPACLDDARLSKTRISFIRETEPLKLLIGTTTQGMFRYDILSQTLQHNEPLQLNPFRSSQLLSCYVDRQENVWVGFYDKGFAVGNRYPDYFNADHTLSDIFKDKFVTRVVEDRYSNLWISTRYDGLYCYTSAGKLTAYHVQNSDLFPAGNDFLESLFIDSKDRIWIGFDNWLVVGDISTDGHLRSWERIDLQHVRVVKEDKYGNIWLGTWFGLFRIDCGKSLAEMKRIYPVHAIANVPDICILRSGDLLFSSYGEGVFRIRENDTVPELYHSPAIVSPVTAKCITMFEDSRQRIWMGSYGNGMLCLSEGKYSVFTWNSGLPSNNVLCFQEDINGCMWMSTSCGISKLKFSPTDTVFTNYFSSDGIPGDQYHEKAGCRRSDGRIFFSGNHGLTFFNPAHILPSRTPPVVNLEDLKILNQSVQPAPEGSVLTKSIALTGKITLNHRQTTISLDYAGIDFIAPGKLTYRYRMEGFDPKWNDVGSFRRATYSNLSPGKYTFLVSAINGDGAESIRPASLQITVKPAPWFSWQAWLLYALLLIAVIILLFRFWFKIKMNRQLLEIEHNEREREQEISEMKINFFTNISHELRTPLTLISAPLEQLMSLKSSDAAGMWLLNTISRNVQSMLRLINQLLDFGKIENGILSLAVRQIDIMQQVRNIRDGFAYTAERKHIRMAFLPHVPRLNLWIDADKLEKILHNLLSNALKYTPENGSVEILTNELSGIEAGKIYPGMDRIPDMLFIEITVLDTGPGIPAEKLGDLFVRYRQINGPSGLRPDYGGSGIGLHYTKRLVEKHNGRISAGIRPEGGMLFSFILPAEDIYPENEKDQTVKDVLPDSMEKDLPKRQEPAGQKYPYTILIAEDNIELMDFIRNILCDRYQLMEALDGDKAWELTQKESPDLILSDVIMPGLSGYRLCAQVKQHPALCHIPVILLTAKTAMFDQVEGLEQGADAYICKPFNIDYLLLSIKNLFMSRDRLRQYFSTPQTQENVSIPVPLNRYDTKFMDKLTRLLEQKLSTPDLNIDCIARDLGFSRTGFYRKIKGLTDMSPVDFLTGYRLKRAAEKIMENEQPLTTIAEQTGFNSYSYFSKSFKKHFGVTPREYSMNH
jgi:signal transduction histidine kinase/ligand-binding sensor domain-containing protein/DNA-binding response OmpR family regulator